MIAESALPDSICEENENLLQNRELAVEMIKQNLIKAQARMKHYADKKRQEREFSVGDMVYLKLQPYRHTSLSLHGHLKLHSKFYGPFRVLQRIGKHAYKLLLPEGCQLHDTFHVSQLKKHIGPEVVQSPQLPLVGPDGLIKMEPEAVLERKLIPRRQGSISIPVVRWLIKWVNMPVEEATWEDSAFIQKEPGMTVCQIWDGEDLVAAFKHNQEMKRSVQGPHAGEDGCFLCPRPKAALGTSPDRMVMIAKSYSSPSTTNHVMRWSLTPTSTLDAPGSPEVLPLQSASLIS
ncbi:hypothetical protein D1007_01615 [Hordeum vulgare]|nr:hypothetical protein D1007_01615 [Hordeum vulgare]